MYGTSHRDRLSLLCDEVASKQLQMKFLSSKDQLADILTKPWLSSHFSTMAFNLNMCGLPLHLRERVRTSSTKPSSSSTQSKLFEDKKQ